MPVIVVTRLRLSDPALFDEFFASAVAVTEQAGTLRWKPWRRCPRRREQRVLDTHRLAGTRPDAGLRRQ